MKIRFFLLTTVLMFLSGILSAQILHAYIACDTEDEKNRRQC